MITILCLTLNITEPIRIIWTKAVSPLYSILLLNGLYFVSLASRNSTNWPLEIIRLKDFYSYLKSSISVFQRKNCGVIVNICMSNEAHLLPPKSTKEARLSPPLLQINLQMRYSLNWFDMAYELASACCSSYLYLFNHKKGKIKSVWMKIRLERSGSLRRFQPKCLRRPAQSQPCFEVKGFLEGYG